MFVPKAILSTKRVQLIIHLTPVCGTSNSISPSIRTTLFSIRCFLQENQWKQTSDYLSDVGRGADHMVNGAKYFSRLKV